MPAKPRRLIIDPNLSRYYHIDSRCVRKAFLFLQEDDHRKQRFRTLLKRLHAIYAVDVCRYALMDNHVHMVLRLNIEAAEQWSAQQVARRWATLHPPRHGRWVKFSDEEIDDWVLEMAKDETWVEQTRQRLMSISWFMRDLKHPIAVEANRQDNATGHFWEGRFGSRALMDRDAILAVFAYVDLNPFAAGIGQVPEEAPFTSLHECVASRKKVEQETNPNAGRSRQPAPVFPERHIWFSPFDVHPIASVPRATQDCLGSTTSTTNWIPTHMQTFSGVDPKLVQPVLSGVSLDSYLRLLDLVSRRKRAGKKSLDPKFKPLLERLEINPANFTGLLDRLGRGLKRLGDRLGHTPPDGSDVSMAT